MFDALVAATWWGWHLTLGNDSLQSNATISIEPIFWLINSHFIDTGKWVESRFALIHEIRQQWSFTFSMETLVAGQQILCIFESIKNIVRLCFWMTLLTMCTTIRLHFETVGSNEFIRLFSTTILFSLEVVEFVRIFHWSRESMGTASWHRE